MNSRDAIMKALTPDDMFNQKGLVWRSTSTLAQFASVEQAEVLVILDEHFQGLVSVRPNGKHPENGPLVALNEHIQPDPPAGEPQVADVGPGTVAAAIEGVAAAANGDVYLGANPHGAVLEHPIPIVDGDGAEVPGDEAPVHIDIGGPGTPDEDLPGAEVPDDAALDKQLAAELEGDQDHE